MELDKRDEAEEHKTYELVREAECKLAQIIVQARVPFAKSAYTKTNTWFNLEIPDIDDVSSKLVTWRNQALVPLHVLIFVVEPSEDGSEGSEKRVLLEHWRIKLTPLEPSLSSESSFTSGSPPTAANSAARKDASSRLRDPAAVHKRIVVLTRAVYSYVRIMPGYKVYRERIRNKSAGLQTEFRFTFNPGVDVLEELEQTPTINFDFGDIETRVGVLSANVTYRSKYLLKARPALMQLNVVEDYAPMSPTRSGAVAIPSPSPGKMGMFSPASAPARRATVSAGTAQISRTYSAEPPYAASPVVGSMPEHQEIMFGSPKPSTSVPTAAASVANPVRRDSPHRHRSHTVGAYAAPSTSTSVPNDPLFAPFTLNKDPGVSPTSPNFDFANTLASPPVPAPLKHMSPNLNIGDDYSRPNQRSVSTHGIVGVSPTGSQPGAQGAYGAVPLSSSPSPSASPSPSPSASSSFEHVFRPFRQRTGVLKRPSSSERPQSIISPFRDVPVSSNPTTPSTSLPGTGTNSIGDSSRVPGGSPPLLGQYHPFGHDSPPLRQVHAANPPSFGGPSSTSSMTSAPDSSRNIRRNDSDSLLFKADDILLDDNDDLPPLGVFDSASSPTLALAASRNPELNEIEQFLFNLDQLPPLQLQTQPLANLLGELDETQAKLRAAQAKQ